MKHLFALLIIINLYADFNSFGFFLGVSEKEIIQKIDTLKMYDIIVIDGDISINAVNILRKSNIKVLGYISVGTIEKYRSWYNKSKKYRLGFWQEWDEWYANVNHPGFRKIILEQVKKYGKKFDGLFFDNYDMIEIYPRQTYGMLQIFKESRKILKNKLLFNQNGSEVLSKFIKYIDGWNQEGFYSLYNFNTQKYELNSSYHDYLPTINKLKRLNKTIFLTSYSTNQDLIPEIINKSCEVYGLPFIAEINLNQIIPPSFCHN